MTTAELLKNLKSRLRAANIDTYSIDARLIAQRATGLSELALITHDREPCGEEAIITAQSLLERRLRLEPMQYILGECEFMGLSLRVTPDVLIPRPDTENVVEAAIKIIKEKGCKSVLDLCTGSGAIAVSLAKYTDARVTASDISEGALAVARQNAQANNASVNFIESDLFDSIDGRFDLIISNPPYIESAVIPTLSAQVREYEPLLALDGGDSGLDFYNKIIHNAQDFLNPDGFLVFEIGYNQGKAVAELMQNAQYEGVYTGKDLALLDRFVIGFLPHFCLK